MPDEPIASAELSNLVSEMQNATSAYMAVVAQLTDSTNLLCDQIASAVTRSIHDQMNAMVEWQTQWAGQIQNVQELFAALAKDIAGAGPRILSTLEKADHVGKLGWTVTMSMSLPDMIHLSCLQVPTEADDYMRRWYETHDSDLSRLEKRILKIEQLKGFHTPISQCFTACRRGDYAITMSFLTAAFEAGIRNLGPAERRSSGKVKKMVKDLYEKAREQDSLAIEVFLWMSLDAFVQWFYKGYERANPGDNRVFRNGLQHGTQPPPNEKVEVIRLLHALDAIGGVVP